MSSAPKVRFLDRTTPPHVATLVFLAGMAAMVMNIFLPSLTGMADYFDAEYRIMLLSVSFYLGMSAFLQLFIGPISDKYGRRPVIMAGTVLFLIATLGCLFAPNTQVFLAFRMMQAMMAVGMVLSRAAVRDMYPQDQAASMIGYVTMGMALVPMISPAIGGVLDQFFGWRASFWLLFLLGVGLLVLTWADFGETVKTSGLTITQQFREYPTLLKAPRFWGYCGSATFSSGAFFAFLGGAPFIGKEIFGLSPAMLGLYFGAPAAGYAVGNFLTGRYAARFGINQMILWGCIFSSTGVAIVLTIFLFTEGSTFVFFFFMTSIGLGNGLAIPNSTAGMLSVRPHLAGTASGLGGSVMLAGGAALGWLAGAVLSVDTGATPLLWIMLATSLMGILSITLTIRREKRLEL